MCVRMYIAVIHKRRHIFTYSQTPLHTYTNSFTCIYTYTIERYSYITYITYTYTYACMCKHVDVHHKYVYAIHPVEDTEHDEQLGE